MECFDGWQLVNWDPAVYCSELRALYKDGSRYLHRIGIHELEAAETASDFTLHPVISNLDFVPLGHHIHVA